MLDLLDPGHWKVGRVDVDVGEKDLEDVCVKGWRRAGKKSMANGAEAGRD